jgi:hypothetical protein
LDDEHPVRPAASADDHIRMVDGPMIASMVEYPRPMISHPDALWNRAERMIARLANGDGSY